MEKQYMVVDSTGLTETFTDKAKAEKVYESWKDQFMEDVVEGTEEVMIVEVLKKAVMVEDEERMQRENPKESGYDFWVKWSETDYV